MTHPESISNPFFNAGPSWAQWPLIILATMATGKFIPTKNFFLYIISIFLVIASQAIITGVFSLVSQASSLGYSPPLRVIHTSNKVIGQIYVPVRFIHNLRRKKHHFYHFQGINWIIMLLTLTITVYFGSSTRLAHACKLIE